MGILIPLRRTMRQHQLDSLREYATVGEIHDEFLSTSYRAFQRAMRRIASARAQFKCDMRDGDESAPELLALGFALYQLRPLGVNAKAILDSVANTLWRVRASYRDKAIGEIFLANDHAASHGLPRRSVIEQTLGPNGDDVSQAIHDRSRWLKMWRRRLGITQAEAARILGYGDRRQVGKIEAGFSRPAWEKIFIAIAVENARAAHAKNAAE
jgi:DNA-binding XRE family transcriptional regulator